MALKNVRRVTFSLPKTTIYKLKISVPKNKRSRFVADLINKNIPEKEQDIKPTLAEIHRKKTL